MVDYMDGSHYNWPIMFTGLPLVVWKATQGTGYVDATYGAAKFRARTSGVKFAAYHWLESTANPIDQAARCFGIVGPDVPLMVDDEETINVAHTLRFVDTYRALGGIVHAEYLPRHRWQASGSPDLRPLVDAGLFVVASHYGAGPETTAGWAPYGGITPSVLQYTDSFPWDGKRVDFNRYRGTTEELWSLMTTGGNVPLDLTTKTAAGVSVDAVLSGLWQILPTLRNDDVRLNFLANTSGLVDTVKAVLAAVTAETTNTVTVTPADADMIAQRVITALAIKLG